MRLGALARTVAGLLMAGTAVADTVYLNGGAAVDGVVTKPNANTVVVEMEGGSLTFQASEVERIEANAKRGQFVNPVEQRREEELTRVTGLTREQREEMADLMAPLKSEKASEQVRARDAILKKGKELDLFRYLEWSLGSFSGLYAPQVLTLLNELYPDPALPVLRKFALHVEPVTRAKALELLGARDSHSDMTLMARGALDHDPEVQSAAIKALLSLNDRRATPVLLQCLAGPDLRVRTTTGAVLTALWKGTPNVPANPVPADWQAFWDAQSSNVEYPIDPKSLRPLVADDTGRPIVYHNE